MMLPFRKESTVCFVSLVSLVSHLESAESGQGGGVGEVRFSCRANRLSCR
jgi:hypothetical protein